MTYINTDARNRRYRRIIAWSRRRYTPANGWMPICEWDGRQVVPSAYYRIEDAAWRKYMTPAP